LNNYTPEELDALTVLDCKYMLAGKEVGENGTPHIQGYIVFLNPLRFKEAARRIPRAHLEPAQGDVEQNYAYCTKEKDFIEIGVKPVSKRQQGENERERWEEIRQFAKKGKFDEIPAKVYVTHLRNIKQIRTDEMQKEKVETLSSVAGVFCYGESGSGKSRWARQQYPDAYIKNCNKWWDGYNGQDSVIIDDLDPGLAGALSHHLKLWLDHYPFTAETKGGSIFIRPKTIILTTQYTLNQLFTETETYQAMKRRMKETHHFNSPLMSIKYK